MNALAWIGVGAIAGSALACCLPDIVRSVRDQWQQAARVIDDALDVWPDDSLNEPYQPRSASQVMHETQHLFDMSTSPIYDKTAGDSAALNTLAEYEAARDLDDARIADWLRGWEYGGGDAA